MLAQFRKGFGPMGQNAIDFYHDDEGKIIRHDWAMGGSIRTIVATVPKSINGYRKLTSEDLKW